MASIHKPILLILFLFCQTKAKFFRTETTENILKSNAVVPQQGVEKSKLSKEDTQKPQQLENEQNPKDSRTNVNVDLKNDKPAEGEKKSIGVEKVQESESGTNSQNEVGKLNRKISQNMTVDTEKGNGKADEEGKGKKKEAFENGKGIDNVNGEQKVGEVIAEEKKLKQEISYLKKYSRSSLEKMPSGEIEILDKELDDFIKVLHTEMEKRNKNRKTEKEGSISKAQIKEIQGEINQAKKLDEILEEIEKEKGENNVDGTMNQNQNQQPENEGHQHYADYFWPHHYYQPIYYSSEQQQPMMRGQTAGLFGYSPYSYQNQEPILIQSFHSHEPLKFSANSNGQQGKNSLNKHKNRPKMNKKSLELNQKPTNNVAVPSSASAPTAVSESAAKNLPQMDSNMSDPDHAKRVLDWERVWKWAETNNQVNKAMEQKRKEEANNNKEADNSKQLQNGGGIDGDKNKPNQKGATGESAGMAKEKTAVTDNAKSGNLPSKTSEPTKEESIKPVLKSTKVETQKPVSKPEETLKQKSGDEKSNSKNNATNNAAATLAKDSQSKGNDGKMKEATKQNEKEGKNVESKKGDDSADNKVKNNGNSAAGGKGMTNVDSADGKGNNVTVTNSDKIETAKQPNREAPKTAPAAKKGEGVRQKKKGGKGNSQNNTIQNNINSSSSSNSSEEDPRAKNGKCETTKVKNEGETTNKKKSKNTNTNKGKPKKERRQGGIGIGYDQSEGSDSDESDNNSSETRANAGKALAKGVAK